MEFIEYETEDDYARVLEEERLVYEDAVKWYYNALAHEEYKYEREYHEQLSYGDMDMLALFRNFLCNGENDVWEAPKVFYVYCNVDLCVKEFKIWAPQAAKKYMDDEIEILLKRAALELDREFERRPYEVKKRVEPYMYLMRIKEMVKDICLRQLDIQHLEYTKEHGANDSGTLMIIAKKISQQERAIEEIKQTAYKYQPKWYVNSLITDCHIALENERQRRY